MGLNPIRRREPMIRLGDAAFPLSAVSTGIMLTGGIGSGKSTAMRSILGQLMRLDCPMVIACVKPDEADQMEALARRVGALDRFVRLRPGQPVVNLLDYLTRRFNTSVTAQFLERLCDIANNASAGSVQGEQFWQSHANTCMHSAIDLALIAQGTASITDIDLIVQTSPATPEDVTDDFFESTPCGLILEAAKKHHRPDERHRFERAYDYFIRVLPGLGDRARGAITSQIQNVVGRLCVEPFREALSGESVITPDLIERDRLIVALDYPTMRHGVAGRLFQSAFLMLTQLHITERSAHGISRPLVLARDECGQVIHGTYDLDFTLTARSQMGACVDAAQDLDMLIRSLGGSAKSQHEALSFASNHRITIAFANSNVRTNDHYQRMFGNSLQIVTSGGAAARQHLTGNIAEDVLGGAGDSRWSQQQLPNLPSDVFTRIATGVGVLMEGGRFQILDLRRRL